MRRAGGWTLALVAVIGMAAAGFLGLRPILFRKPVAVEFVQIDLWTDAEEAGVRRAFAEKGYRAGGQPIQPDFHDALLRSDPMPSILTVNRFGDRWTIEAPSPSSAGPSNLELVPQVSRLGGAAARWAKRHGIRRVFIPGIVELGGFAADFRRQAGSDGLVCTTDAGEPQGRSLLEALGASRAELVLLKLNDAVQLAPVFKQAGYAGQTLVLDTTDRTPNSARAAKLPEGAFLVASYVPDLGSVTGMVPSAGPALQPAESYGYVAARLLLEAIERTSSIDPRRIYDMVALWPGFDPATGASTLPGGLYVVENGRFEFVELLR